MHLLLGSHMTHSDRLSRLRIGQMVWLYYFPLLFLPNLGMGGLTSFGLLDLSDFFLGPYLLLVALQDRRRTTRTVCGALVPLMLLFVSWALFVTLLMTIRYGYDSSFHLVLSLLKLAKFVLYGIAGILTARALVNDRVRREFIRSLAIAGIVVGIGLFFVGQKSAMTEETQALGYKATNAISVMAAILGCYLCGVWLKGKAESTLTRCLLIIAAVSLVVGAAISEGRGGWVAGLAGFVYLCYRGGLRKQSLLIGALAPIFFLILFALSPVFQQRVQFTFFQGNSQGSPIDDGGRPQNFAKGIEQFQQSPILGTGFFHRAGETGLYPHGSHNFFLQMFLETGIPGGLLMLAIWYRLWRLTGSVPARQAGFDVPARAALVAAIVGGMSGEYFYGGITMFALLAVFAACGSLPAKVTNRVQILGKVLHGRQYIAVRFPTTQLDVHTGVRPIPS
jgi:O-antigen ligase